MPGCGTAGCTCADCGCAQGACNCGKCEPHLHLLPPPRISLPSHTDIVLETPSHNDSKDTVPYPMTLLRFDFPCPSPSTITLFDSADCL
ncbi:hypothetical protein DM02DRAFT_618453 [Periconia macrospinosa]|uniref:Metallothionein n=1 Tax=Periconia macrospinosa TaxID=97972 RepID=A0A2V1D9A1_9PLEO|nr:hypothetical protein DM02DRAFT_618453 [Periconia macrospinosa]